MKYNMTFISIFLTYLTFMSTAFAECPTYSGRIEFVSTLSNCVVSVDSIQTDSTTQLFSIADSLSPGDVAPSFPGGVEALK